MAAEWYCRISGAEQGPLTASDLRTMVAEGRLSPGDALRQGIAGVWVPAASVKGLFGGSGHFRGAGRAAATDPEPGQRDRPRPLLRALPMEEESAEPHLIPPPSSLLDRNDAGLDLTRDLSGTSLQAPKRVKGWRSTGLDFLADESSVPAKGPKVQRIAGRGRAKDAAEPIRRWTIPALAGTLVFLLVVWMIVGLLRSSRTASEASDRPAAGSEATAPNEAISQKAGGKAVGPPPKPGQKGAGEAAGTVWIDASRQPWKCDAPEVTVTIRSAAIGRAKAVDGEKRVADTQDDYLLVWIELANRSTTRKIQYTSWNVRGTKPQLADDLKNPYNLQAAPVGTTFDGQQRVKSVYPEKTVEDLLVFERPVDRAKSLRLQLPAGAFEGNGTGYIEIPMSMVKSDRTPSVRPPPPPPASKTAGANGSEKRDAAKQGPSEKPSATKTGETTLPARTGVPEKDFGIK
jgi:hypothetical protein